MTSDPLESGKRFADDLRRIRESRGLDRADLIAALRLDPSILDEFESTGLVGHPRYNRVYLRSFAGGYARVLRIDARAVSTALDSVFAGTYRGSLGVTHLGDSESERFEVIFAAATDSTPAPNRDSPAPRTQISSGTSAPAPPPSAATTPRRITIRRPGVWAGLALALVLFVAAGWWWLTSGLDEVAPLPPTLTESPAPVPVTPRIVVGDTMRLFVVALDTLDPIRVIVDRKMRAPYWILPGDSLSFDVTDHIVFERKADDVAVSFAGRRLPSTAPDSLGTLILTRNRVQELLDSLRTAG